MLRLPSRHLLKPSTNVPDVQTFLQRIGRNMVQHSEHFESWEDLVGSSSEKLKAKGIETRDRRYLIAWLQRYSQGSDLCVHQRGKKKWGGERNEKANKAAFYGRKRAEEKAE